MNNYRVRVHFSMDRRVVAQLLFGFLLLVVATRPIQSRSNSVACGEPLETYVPWDNLRSYANKWFKLGIHSFARGDSLPVKRCGECFHMCDRSTHCGIKTQEYVTKNVQFSINDKNWNLKVTLLEDKICHCVEKKQYSHSCQVTKTPPITCATIEEEEEEKPSLNL